MDKSTGARAAFGTIMMVITGVLAALKFPADVVDIVNGWQGFTLTTEAIQMLLIASLGVLSAWALSRPLGSALHFTIDRWMAGRARKAELSQERLAAAEQARRDKEEQAKRQRDASDFVRAVLSDPGYCEVLALLAEHPDQITLRYGEPLRKAGVAELVIPRTTGPAYHDHYAAYRLTEIGRNALGEVLKAEGVELGSQ